MKKVAVINDLSGLGRCSLTAAISVLSALGVEACPLPTAILSNQTEYDSFYMDDYTDKMDLHIEQWKKLDISFDAISTGFLANTKQAAIVERFIEDFKTPETLLLVDPVMGGDGICYKTLTPELCDRIRSLSFKADIITPNLTEACILLEKEPNLKLPLEEVHQYAKELMKRGAKKVIITDIVADGRIHNIIGENGYTTSVSTKIIGGSYSGTGDLFAAVITAGVLNDKYSLEKIVTTAAEFIEKSVAEAYRSNTNRNDGIPFGKYLPLLWEELQ